MLWAARRCGRILRIWELLMTYAARSNETIAVIGGTGNLGAAIARRLAKAGRKVIIGSRSADSAARTAAELGFGLTGLANAEAATAGSIVIVTVPFAAQEPTLADIAPHVAGKIVV